MFPDNAVQPATEAFNRANYENIEAAEGETPRHFPVDTSTNPKQSCGNVDFSVPNDAHYRPDPWLTMLDQELKLVPTSAT